MNNRDEFIKWLALQEGVQYKDDYRMLLSSENILLCINSNKFDYIKYFNIKAFNDDVLNRLIDKSIELNDFNILLNINVNFVYKVMELLLTRNENEILFKFMKHYNINSLNTNNLVKIFMDNFNSSSVIDTDIVKNSYNIVNDVQFFIKVLRMKRFDMLNIMNVKLTDDIKRDIKDNFLEYYNSGLDISKFIRYFDNDFEMFKIIIMNKIFNLISSFNYEFRKKIYDDAEMFDVVVNNFNEFLKVYDISNYDDRFYGSSKFLEAVVRNNPFYFKDKYYYFKESAYTRDIFEVIADNISLFYGGSSISPFTKSDIMLRCFLENGYFDKLSDFSIECWTDDNIRLFLIFIRMR